MYWFLRDLMYWYFEGLRKYAVVGGRAQRKEYWMFFLSNFLIVFILFLIRNDGLFGKLYGIALCIPSLAVHVRRLHDTGRHGSWMLICLVPVIGPILLLSYLCEDSQPGDNQYGPNPKGIKDNGQQIALSVIAKAKGGKVKL